MAGIQISGLLANQAFDWKSIVDQLVAVDSVPITNLQNDQKKNDDKIAALLEVRTSMETLQDSLQSIRSNSTFKQRNVISSDANSTWKSTSAAGAPIGSYKFEVQTLATASRWNGGADIGQRLNATSADLSGLTMNNLPIAATMKAGTFTVDGKQITFSATDSLKSVLDQIQTATGDVTWSYDQTSDAITLTRASGNLVLGAANDTSNFLQALKLSNSGTGVVTSAGKLGTASQTATLANARLSSAITAVDGTGAGSFSINGVSIGYNVNSDTLTSVMDRINQSTAGVVATYDALNDKFVLTNKSTGNVGITVDEGAGGLLDALNLTTTVAAPGSLTAGTDAKFRVNDGDWITSTSNTLDSAVHGITGLSITANSTGTQTLSVQSDSSTMQTAVQDFLDKFNALQDLIEDKTKSTVNGTTVDTGILYDNREVQTWARTLHQLAFNPPSGVSGSITHLDDLGIDFDGTTGHLAIKDVAKFNTALSNKPQDVQSYFSDNGHGLVPDMYGVLTTLMTNDGSAQESIRKSSRDIGDQITTLQARLDAERQSLTDSFIKMLDAQSAAQSQNQALTNAFFKNNSS